MLTQVETAAGSLGVQLQVVDARSLDEFERAFSDMVKGRADALFQLPSPTFYENRKRIVDLAGLHRMPGMYLQKEFVELGGLIAYGANRCEPPHCDLRRQDPQRGQAVRSARRATHDVRICHQPQDRRHTRHHHTAGTARRG
jgi:hypothetical protein